MTKRKPYLFKILQRIGPYPREADSQIKGEEEVQEENSLASGSGRGGRRRRCMSHTRIRKPSMLTMSSCCPSRFTQAKEAYELKPLGLKYIAYLNKYYGCVPEKIKWTRQTHCSAFCISVFAWIKLVWNMYISSVYRRYIIWAKDPITRANMFLYLLIKQGYVVLNLTIKK